MLFIAVQLSPMLFLVLVYNRVSPLLEQSRLGGVPLTELLLASAVLSPLLTQTVSGPIFRSLETLRSPSFGVIGAVTLRSIPKALLLGVLPTGAAALAVSSLTGTGVRGGLATVAMLGVHLLFAAALVPAFARRSPSLLALGWVTYALGLVLYPTIWWVPAIAGFGSQIVVLAIVSRLRLRGAAPAGIVPMAAGLVKGVAIAFPLWSIPVALFVSARGELSSAVIFAGLIPALIVYHTYFSTVATPLWRTIDEARGILSVRPYHEAKGAMDHLAQRARAGDGRVVVLVIATLLLIIPALLQNQDGDSRLLTVLIVASGFSVILIAQMVRLSMLRPSIVIYLVSAVIGANLIMDTALGMSPTVVLLLHAVVCLAGSGLVTILNRQIWRRPEHALFWRSALSQ